MLGIPIALATGGLIEWSVHKYVLHGLGRKRDSFWAFHWHTHHRNARKHGHLDPDYHGTVFAWNGQGKEALLLTVGAASLLPLAPIAPFFVGTLWWQGLRYYRAHKRAHLDPAWARAHLRCHYDHHMGPDQNANYCALHPGMDVLMGTRAPTPEPEPGWHAPPSVAG